MSKNGNNIFMKIFIGGIDGSCLCLAVTLNSNQRSDIMNVTLKAPITTAADDIHKYFFIVSQRKYDWMFQVNPLLGRGFT